MNEIMSPLLTQFDWTNTEYIIEYICANDRDVDIRKYSVKGGGRE